MRRFIAVLIVAGAAVVGYRYYRGSDATVERYKQFAEAILHRQYDKAAAMTDGLSAADLQQHGTQERIGAGPPMFQTLFPSKYEIDSRETSPDGVVTLRVTQTVFFNPAGVESAIRPAMFATLKQVARLRKSDDGWKVVAFENTFEKMDSLGSR